MSEPIVYHLTLGVPAGGFQVGAALALVKGWRPGRGKPIKFLIFFPLGINWRTTPSAGKAAQYLLRIQGGNQKGRTTELFVSGGMFTCFHFLKKIKLSSNVYGIIISAYICMHWEKSWVYVTLQCPSLTWQGWYQKLLNELISWIIVTHDQRKAKLVQVQTKLIIYSARILRFRTKI